MDHGSLQPLGKALFSAFLIALLLHASVLSGQEVSGDATKECWRSIIQRDAQASQTCIREFKAAIDGGDSLLCIYHAMVGYNAFMQEDRETAKVQLEKAASLFHKEGGRSKVGRKIYRVLAFIYHEESDYPQAVETYYKLLRLHFIHDAEKPRKIGRAHYNLGSVYWGMEQRDSCRFHYAKALELWKGSEEQGGIFVASMHEVLGTYAWEDNDKEAALFHFSEAAKHHLSENAGDAADDLSAKGKEQLEEGLAAQALVSYQSALEFRIKNYGPEHPNTACMYTNIARSFVGLGKEAESLEQVQQGLALLISSFEPDQVLQNPRSVADASNFHHVLDALSLKFALLATLATQEAEASQAEVLDRILETIRELRVGSMSEDSKLYWTVRARQVFEEGLEFSRLMYAKSKKEEHIVRALRIIESSKNVLLHHAERTISARASGILPKELSARERELERTISELCQFIYLEEKKCKKMDVDRLSLWKDELAARRSEKKVLVAQLSVDHPNYHDLKYGTGDDYIRELLRRGTAEKSLMVLFQGEQALYVLTLDDEGLSFEKDERVASIKKNAQELRALLSDRSMSIEQPQESFEAFIHAASFLHDVLFPAGVQENDSPLLVVADGVFQYLPFGVLLTTAVHDRERDYRSLPYLIKKRPISYLSSLRSFRRAQVEGEGSAYIGFAPIYHDADSGLSPLAYSSLEVDHLQAMFEGRSYLGEYATEAAFKKEAGRSSILHLAMHTILNDVEPLYSSFVFSSGEDEEDGLLNMYEVLNLKMDTRLTILSACSTGDGVMRHGEGVMSLARAFAYVGCPSVLMSHWNCEDRTASELIQTFAHSVVEGKDLSSALQGAKVDYLKSADRAKAHPYYWASMSLIGDTEEIGLAGPWYTRLWLFALFAVVLVVFLRKKFF